MSATRVSSTDEARFKIGDRVKVYGWGTAPDREFIGAGTIELIDYVHQRGGYYEAAVRVDGQHGRYLRRLSELEPEAA